MLGIGFFEILIIAVICLIALGPKELPAIMRNLAKFYRQFLDLKEELRFQILSAEEPQGPRSKKADAPMPELIEAKNKGDSGHG